MKSLPDHNNCTVAVIGMGYVGLPLATSIKQVSKCYKTGVKLNRKVIGFDINKERISELNNSYDRTNELTQNELCFLKEIIFTNTVKDLGDADIFIVTVPTPIFKSKNPDLNFIQEASTTLGKVIKFRNNETIKTSTPIVIFESTVYPGLTEDICIPILEKESGGKVNQDFLCGYSPERVNPGDRERSIKNIVKLTSGKDQKTSLWIDKFYSSFISAGTYMTKSIKIAEMAKIIENTQRDINIALMNELAIICRKLEIDTLKVLEAANTKWNFLDFKPGLVGGHCIGVDPYYLTYCSQMADYYPEMVLSGRRVNDKIGEWLIEEFITELAKDGLTLSNSNFLILGITFKENCKDIRNSGVFKMIKKIKTYGISLEVCDPYFEKDSLFYLEYAKVSKTIPKNKKFDAVIAAVAHDEFLELAAEDWKNLIKPSGKFLDVKGIIPEELNPLRL